ncbi:hypothetical protein J4218_03125 [Candidatus Pacearchaeota archaeon]|nr:hypothetical protein [Candidatus Pacearchaeota archaeon]
MEFKYYNPKRLVPALKERGVMAGAYRVCQGCVYTHVPPEDCYHHSDDFTDPGIQSDCFCLHCVDTIRDSGEKFYLRDDPDLNKKVAELEEILRMMEN